MYQYHPNVFYKYFGHSFISKTLGLVKGMLMQKARVYILKFFLQIHFKPFLCTCFKHKFDGSKHLSNFRPVFDGPIKLFGVVYRTVKSVFDTHTQVKLEGNFAVSTHLHIRCNNCSQGIVIIFIQVRLTFKLALEYHKQILTNMRSPYF